MDINLDGKRFRSVSNTQPWTVAYWLLMAAFVLSAALNMLHIRAGFLTNHLSDVVVPALLYVIGRGLVPGIQARPRWAADLLRRSPAQAAVLLFVASAVTEVSQIWWPRGVFSGRFDPLDLVSFAVGLAACWAAESRWPGMQPS